MFYRVDYVVGLMLFGFVIGLLIGKRTAVRAPNNVAKAYYVLVTATVIIGFLANAVVMLHGPSQGWTFIAGLAGSIGNFIFGALFGMAVRCAEPEDLLTQPPVLAALRMAVAFTFALAGIGKAFSMPFMIGFFTQSGYTVEFLKFVMFAEVLGGVGLLVPWAFLPSLFGLTIDMFGAVATHVRNGDPLNDSTGAINMLIRLSAIGAIWALSSSADKPIRITRLRLVGVFIALVVALGIAVAGSFALHHSSQTKSETTTATLEHADTYSTRLPYDEFHWLAGAFVASRQLTAEGFTQIGRQM